MRVGGQMMDDSVGRPFRREDRLADNRQNMRCSGDEWIWRGKVMDPTAPPSRAKESSRLQCSQAQAGLVLGDGDLFGDLAD